MMRHKGPRPIELHMAYMMHIWHSSSAFMLGTAPATLIPYIQQEILKRQTKFMQGWQAYMNFEKIDVSHRNRDVFWEEGNSRCLHEPQPSGQPVLLIPSLVNKSYIMDLLPEFSFFDTLKKAGFSPYLLDWGDIGGIEQSYDMDEYLSQRLFPLIDKIVDETGQKPIGLGYCMGGLVLAAAMTHKQDQFKAAGFLACPWDFHTNQEPSISKARFFYEAIKQVITLRGIMDIDLIQAFFTTLDPLLSSKKFARFADIHEEKEKAKEYVAVEDWINDGVPMSTPLAHHCFKEFYLNNTPAKGNWQVLDKIVDLSKFNHPALCVIAKKDQLVPPISSKALVESLPNVTTLEQDTGHIGIMGSVKQTKTLWPQIVDWMNGLENRA